MDGAIGIAMQIIAALEAAHERGIVHRDLKPANIKLRSDGVVKVLDFGIAKAYGDPVTSTDSQPAVLTTPVTQTGIILGTAAYMSPEQARGLPIDQRADIWAFGCVLYEMLTGQSAFGGEDVPMTLARVLAQDTDIKSLPATISPAVRQTLRVCLRKELSERVADIRDVRLALEGAFEADVAVRGAALESPRASWRRRLGISVALLSSAAIAGFGGWSLRTTPDPALVRSLLTPPESARYTPTSADPHLAITSDGSRVVYVGQADGRQRIFVRDLARLEASTLTDLTTLIRSVFVSFDGSEVGYSDGSALYRVPIVGGQPEMITDALDGFPRGAAWGPDGTIVFASSGPGGLWRVPASGGEPQAVTTPEPGMDHVLPSYLPDGSGVLFTILRPGGDLEVAQIAHVALPSLETRVLFSGGTNPQYAASGHILFARGTDLAAVRFAPGSPSVATSPVTVVSGINVTEFGVADFAIAQSGTLVYATGGVSAEDVAVVAFDRDGGERVLDLPAMGYSHPRVSPDGTRLAVDVAAQDVWIVDLERETVSRMTTTPDMDNRPDWTPDGEQVVFASLREGLGRFSFFRQRADGTGEAEKLLTSVEPGQFKAHGWSPDGTQMVFDYGRQPALDIGVLSIDGKEDWQPLLASEANEAAPSLSPDGNWIAYASDRTGRCEVYVERFPQLGNRRQISTDGGAEVLWSRTGDELFYRERTRLMAVRADLGPVLSVGQPEAVLTGLRNSPDCLERAYDVSYDGRTIYIVRDRAGAEPDLILVQNWLQELGRLVPTR
jgi:Tol biopolymer transport system component